MDATLQDEKSEEPEQPWVPVWNGERYAANTGHHREHDRWFLETFPIAPTDRLLDLGCGSGDFSRLVADLVPDGSMVCVDAQPSMVEVAQAVAAANQSFVVAPVQSLDRVFPASADGSFDAVFSRSTLHWVPRADHPGVLRSAFRLVKPGGFLRIECGGAGNIPVTMPALDKISADFDGPQTPWTFFDAGTYLELVEQAGFELGADSYVRTVAQHRAFDSETFHGWVHSQAVEAYLAGIDPDRHDGFLRAVEDRFDNFRHHNGTFDQTYVRLDLLVRKPL